jgi:hypothetical protein
MRPLGFEGSDGLQNLTESLLAMRLLAPGVCIIFHSQALSGRQDRDLGAFIPIK